MIRLEPGLDVHLGVFVDRMYRMYPAPTAGRKSLVIIKSVMYSGGYFAAIAAADRNATGRILEIVLPYHWFVMPSFEIKGAVLLVTGASAAALYISVIGTIYGKLLDPEPARVQVEPNTGRSRDQKDADKGLVAISSG
jgi:hypothetical protein